VRQAFRFLVELYNGSAWAVEQARGAVEERLAELFRRQRQQHEAQGRVNKILLDESSVEARLLSVDLVFSGLFGKGPVSWPVLRVWRWFRMWLMMVTRTNPMLFWAGAYNCGVEARVLISARLRSEWQQLQLRGSNEEAAKQEDAPELPPSDEDYEQQEHVLTLYFPLGPEIPHQQLMDMAKLKWLENETEYNRVRKVCEDAISEGLWRARNFNQVLPLPHPFNAARIALGQALFSQSVRADEKESRDNFKI